MRVIEASWLDRLGRLCACAVLAVLPLAANAADEDPWEGFNRPVFSFNAQGIYVPGKQPTPAQRISRWPDLLARMQQEGFMP